MPRLICVSGASLDALAVGSTHRGTGGQVQLLELPVRVSCNAAGAGTITCRVVTREIEVVGRCGADFIPNLQSWGLQRLTSLIVNLISKRASATAAEADPLI